MFVFACLGPLILKHIYLQHGGLVLLLLCDVLDVPYLKAILPDATKCTSANFQLSVCTFWGIRLT